MNQKNLGFIFCVAVLFFSSAYSMKRKRDDSGKRAQEEGKQLFCKRFYCRYLSLTKAEIDKHLRLHGKKDNQLLSILQCGICDFLTDDMCSYNMHIKSHDIARQNSLVQFNRETQNFALQALPIFSTLDLPKKMTALSS